MSISGLAAIFATAFVVSLTGALSPGPLTTLAVREGVRRGFWAGPALAIGHGVIELALVVALALGLERLLDRDGVAATVALIGGAFLLWLGARIIITAPRQELAIGVPAEPEGQRRGAGWLSATVAEGAALDRKATVSLAVSGVAVSVANPFWLLWWVTIGAAYIATALDEGALGVGVFFSAHFLSDLGWLSLIALLMASGRRIMSRRAYQGVLMACGVFLLGLGGWFLASGLGYVF